MRRREPSNQEMISTKDSTIVRYVAIINFIVPVAVWKHQLASYSN